MWHVCVCVCGCGCVCVCVCDTGVHSFECTTSSKVTKVSNTWVLILWSSLKSFYIEVSSGYDLVGLF
jgi:hypothetical protein